MLLDNCSIADFYDISHGKTVVCFGAGSLIKSVWFKAHCECEFPAKQILFIDSDEKKWGESFKLWNREFTVNPPSLLKSFLNKEFILLITCMAQYMFEIIPQLQSIGQFEMCNLYIFDIMRTNPEANVASFYKDYNESPELFQNYRANLEKLNLKDKYKGKRCFIIGNGPSLKAEDLEKLSKDVTFASNAIYKIFPDTTWRPTFYATSDTLNVDLNLVDQFYKDNICAFVSLEASVIEAKILKRVNYYNILTPPICYDEMGNIMIEYDKAGEPVNGFQFSDDIVRGVFASSTITCILLQFAAYMGFKTMYFLGVDQNARGVRSQRDVPHFSSSYVNCKRHSAVDDKIFRNMPDFFYRGPFIQAKKHLEQKGIKVFDATRNGAMTIFPKVDFGSLSF